MMVKLKLVVVFQTIIIIALIVILITIKYKTQPDYLNNEGKIKLLSPRIYAKILPPESYLILNFKLLQNSLREFIVSNHLNISIYLLNMRNGASFGINANDAFEPASLTKLPMAIIILKKVEEGKLSLDTLLPINDEDRDKGYGTLYANPINKLSVKDLLYYMLVESDDTAAKVLSKYITLKDMYYVSTYLNYYNTEINYTNPEFKYKVTPKSIGNIFLSLYLSTILNPDDSEMILSMLTNSSFNIKSYAALPDDVAVAQKFGMYYVGNDTSQFQFHDCGILYIKDSRIFYCIMTKNLNEVDANKIIGTILNTMYTYVNEARKIKDLHI